MYVIRFVLMFALISCSGHWASADTAPTTLAPVEDSRLGTYAAGGLGLFASADVWKADIAQVQKLNMGIVRGNTDTWDLLEPQQGTYKWDALDAVETLLNNAHVDLLFTVPISNKWNRGANAPSDGGKKISPTHFATPDLASVSDFCKTLAARYKGRITYYEVWNEPDFDVFWEGKADAKKYLAFIQAAYQGLKEGNPDCVVLMGGLAKPSNPEWFDQFLSLGGGQFFDRANIHVYPAFGTLSSALQTVRNTMQKYNVQKPIWITETSSTGMYFDTSDKTAEEHNKAVYLVKNYAEALSQPDVERVFWHSLRNPGADVHIRELNFALLTEKGDPLPAYWAYTFLRDELLNSQPLGRLNWNGVDGYSFDNKGKRIVILWATSGTAHTSLPAEFTKARLITLFGKPRDITPQDFAQVAITSEPVYLELEH